MSWVRPGLRGCGEKEGCHRAGTEEPARRGWLVMGVPRRIRAGQGPPRAGAENLNPHNWKGLGQGAGEGGQQRLKRPGEGGGLSRC